MDNAVIVGSGKHPAHWNRWIRIWLSTGIVMLMIQVLLGGVTRLTGSGLSITEWKPLLGAIPPMDKASWQVSFGKYQQIAQFKKLNPHFTLADYQAIFFWEWLHREWARLMGLVFVLPLLSFLFRKKITGGTVIPMLILFILGGLQGAVGWIMVQSGLNDQDVAVSHIRLAFHLICALFLLCYLLWFTLEISFSPSQGKSAPRLKCLLTLLLLLMPLQLVYGAFMAGTHAALFALTWPGMNGSFLPGGITGAEGIRHQLVYNPLVTQFIHRNLAYLIALLTGLYFYQAGRCTGDVRQKTFRWILLILVAIQVALGVLTLLSSAYHPIFLPILHQFAGMLLLMAVLTAYFFTKHKTK